MDYSPPGLGEEKAPRSGEKIHRTVFSFFVLHIPLFLYLCRSETESLTRWH
jgi:hypothetical protein